MKVIALCLRLKSKLRRREIKKAESPVTRSSTEVEKSILRVTLAVCSTNISLRNFKFSAI